MNFSDLLPESSLRSLASGSVKPGNVYRIKMGAENGITPKNPGDTSRNKFFIVLGVCPDGSVYGGVVINSEMNKGIPANLREYHIPLQRIRYGFLGHDSYVDCVELKTVPAATFARWRYLGEIGERDFEIIKNAAVSNPAAKKAELKLYGLV